MISKKEIPEEMTMKHSKERYPEDYWDAVHEYLQNCYLLQHNDDYLEFLVKQVWELDQPCRLVEFGCGTGKMGRKLLPLLPKGSSYIGIDKSATLLIKAQEVWDHYPWKPAFYQGSIYDPPFKSNSFDIALTHTALMHVPNVDQVLTEMIRVTRDSGMVITCEANRNAHTALLHIEEINHQEDVPLALFQKINTSIRQQTGVDHNIGVKMPILMHKAGLADVQARLSDAVRPLIPPVNTVEKENIYQAICDEGYGQPQPDEGQLARWKARLIGYGISEQAAQAEIERELAQDFLNKGKGYHTVFTTLLTWSYGRVVKSHIKKI
jgi:ubiquinone/menaquinone biosynthesis C-methylase UbiE